MGADADFVAESSDSEYPNTAEARAKLAAHLSSIKFHCDSITADAEPLSHRNKKKVLFDVHSMMANFYEQKFPRRRHRLPPGPGRP